MEGERCVCFMFACVFLNGCVHVYIYYLLAVPSYLSSDILVCFIFMYPHISCSVLTIQVWQNQPNSPLQLPFASSEMSGIRLLVGKRKFQSWSVQTWNQWSTLVEQLRIPVLTNVVPVQFFFYIECRLKLYTSYNYQRIMIIITAFVIVFDAVIIISLFAYIKKRLMSSQGMPSKGLIY